MRRTYETLVDVSVGLLDIITVLLNGVGDALDMIMRVVDYLVTFVQNALIEFRVFAHVVANHEESSLCIEFLEGLEDKRSSLWDGAVIESQID